ncbi:MAG: ATP-binding protein [Microthrixaceae bacterium]
MAASIDSRRLDSGGQFDAEASIETAASLDVSGPIGADGSVGFGPAALISSCRMYRGDVDDFEEVHIQMDGQASDPQTDPGAPLRSLDSSTVVNESGDVSLAALFDEYADDRQDDSASEVMALVFARDDVAGIDWGALSLSAAGVATVKQSRRAFTGDTTPTALRSLRTWASEQVGLREIQCDELQLVVSELATNVERYAPGWVMIDLVFYRGMVLVAVTDRATDSMPELGPSRVVDTSGRGLWIVAAVSVAWGVVRRASSKTIWSLLRSESTGDGLLGT